MLKQCLVCEKVLKTESSEDRPFSRCIDIMYSATIWRSTGNFGSSLFDPMTPKGRHEFLEAYICDECLVTKGKLLYHVDIKVVEVENVNAKTYEEYRQSNNITT